MLTQILCLSLAAGWAVFTWYAADAGNSRAVQTGSICASIFTAASFILGAI